MNAPWVIAARADMANCAVSCLAPKNAARSHDSPLLHPQISPEPRRAWLLNLKVKVRLPLLMMMWVWIIKK